MQEKEASQARQVSHHTSICRRTPSLVSLLWWLLSLNWIRIFSSSPSLPKPSCGFAVGLGTLQTGEGEQKPEAETPKIPYQLFADDHCRTEPHQLMLDEKQKAATRNV
jgi:hypothetical protein